VAGLQRVEAPDRFSAQRRYIVRHVERARDVGRPLARQRPVRHGRFGDRPRLFETSFMLRDHVEDREVGLYIGDRASGAASDELAGTHQHLSFGALRDRELAEVRGGTKTLGTRERIAAKR
jgi:hypothetical protein